MNLNAAIVRELTDLGVGFHSVSVSEKDEWIEFTVAPEPLSDDGSGYQCMIRCKAVEIYANPDEKIRLAAGTIKFVLESRKREQ